jgi:nucleoside-diphosphate-sugar epimerase
MSSLLVTGASGHLGTALLAHLIKATTLEILALVHSEASALRLQSLFGNKIEIARLDLSEADTAILTKRDFTAVVHGAAYIPAVHDEDRERRRLYETNVKGTLRLLAAISNRTEYMVYISSLAVYAKAAAEQGAIAEDAPLLPTTFYGASKLISERCCNQWATSLRIPIAILRIGSLYGPGEIQPRVLPALFERSRRNEPIVLDAMGKSLRNYTYVEDVARAIGHVLTHKICATINIGGQQVFSLSRLATEIVSVSSSQSRIYKLPGTPRDLVLSTRSARELGVVCDTPLSRGLRAQHAWLSSGDGPNRRDFFHFLTG